MSAIEIPWTFYFEASESPVVTAGQPYFIDAQHQVSNLIESIVTQVKEYCGQFECGVMRCLPLAFQHTWTKLYNGMYRYAFSGVALIEADFKPHKRKPHMRTETEVEQEIRAKGLNAPRLTPELIDAQISSEHYFRASDAWSHNYLLPDAEALAKQSLPCLTVCVLVLRNGFKVVGTSSCVSEANFDADIGRNVARENARRQVWELEGYLLKSMLANMVSPRDPIPPGAVVGSGQATAP